MDKIKQDKEPETLNELLSHEQGHYDIGEVFANDLQKTLSNTCLDKNNYKFEADSLFKAMNAHYDSLQLKYDVDTDHMRNKEMQLKWKEKIAAMVDRI